MPINLPEEYWDVAAKIADDSSIIDPWEDLLLEKGFGDILGMVPKLEVFNALGLVSEYDQNVTARDAKRVATVMNRLGFESCRPTHPETRKRTRCWSKIEANDGVYWTYDSNQRRFVGGNEGK